MKDVLRTGYETALPSMECAIVGLPIGEIRYDPTGNAQVYLGGNSVEQLTPYDTASLRDGAILVKMWTIDGRTDADYAEITIKTPLTDWSATERGIALRFGGTKPIDLIERTPIQIFSSPRAFQDIPLSGRARWLAVSPEGMFSEGLFDDSITSANQVATFGQGWTFVWIVEGSRPFKFGELCSPRFIDATDTCPEGEAGITEVISPDDLLKLPQTFQNRFALYTSGEHLRIKAA